MLLRCFSFNIILDCLALSRSSLIGLFLPSSAYFLLFFYLLCSMFHKSNDKYYAVRDFSSFSFLYTCNPRLVCFIMSISYWPTFLLSSVYFPLFFSLFFIVPVSLSCLFFFLRYSFPPSFLFSFLPFPFSPSVFRLISVHSIPSSNFYLTCSFLFSPPSVLI